MGGCQPSHSKGWGAQANGQTFPQQLPRNGGSYHPVDYGGTGESMGREGKVLNGEHDETDDEGRDGDGELGIRKDPENVLITFYNPSTEGLHVKAFQSKDPTAFHEDPSQQCFGVANLFGGLLDTCMHGSDKFKVKTTSSKLEIKKQGLLAKCKHEFIVEPGQTTTVPMSAESIKMIHVYTQRNWPEICVAACRIPGDKTIMLPTQSEVNAVRDRSKIKVGEEEENGAGGIRTYSVALVLALIAVFVVPIILFQIFSFARLVPTPSDHTPSPPSSAASGRFVPSGNRPPNNGGGSPRTSSKPSPLRRKPAPKPSSSSSSSSSSYSLIPGLSKIVTNDLPNLPYVNSDQMMTGEKMIQTGRSAAKMVIPTTAAAYVVYNYFKDRLNANVEIQHAISKQQNRTKDLQHTVDLLRVSERRLRESIHMIEAARSDAEAKGRELRGEISVLHNALNRAQASLKAKSEQAARAADDAAGKIKKLNTDVSELKTQVSQLVMMQASSKAEIKLKEKELAAYRRELTNLRKDMSTAESSARNAVGTEKARIAELTQVIRNLRDELKKTKYQRQVLEDRMRAQTAAIDVAKSEKIKYEDKIQNLDMVVQAHRNKVNSLTDALQRKTEALTTTSAESQNHQRTIKELQISQKRVEEELAARSKELAEARANLKVAEDTAAKLKITIKEMDTDIEHLELKISHAEQKGRLAKPVSSSSVTGLIESTKDIDATLKASKKSLPAFSDTNKNAAAASSSSSSSPSSPAGGEKTSSSSSSSSSSSFWLYGSSKPAPPPAKSSTGKAFPERLKNWAEKSRCWAKECGDAMGKGQKSVAKWASVGHKQLQAWVKKLNEWVQTQRKSLKDKNINEQSVLATLGFTTYYLLQARKAAYDRRLAAPDTSSNGRRFFRDSFSRSTPVRTSRAYDATREKYSSSSYDGDYSKAAYKEFPEVMKLFYSSNEELDRVKRKLQQG
eukprot:jgi/Bigna1/86227/estExt_fgenesh1_pg.C_90043